MGNETFYCSCGHDFDERPLLEIHKQTCPTLKEILEIEKENKPPKVDQFNCDKVLSTSKHHNYQVHPKPQKLNNFQCDKCDRSFSTSSRLWHHNYGVHPKHLFKCATCGRTFKAKAILKRHQLVHTGEKPFSCELCSKGFTQKNNLKMHTLKFHPSSLIH